MTNNANKIEQWKINKRLNFIKGGKFANLQIQIWLVNKKNGKEKKLFIITRWLESTTKDWLPVFVKDKDSVDYHIMSMDLYEAYKYFSLVEVFFYNRYLSEKKVEDYFKDFFKWYKKTENNGIISFNVGIIHKLENINKFIFLSYNFKKENDELRFNGLTIQTKDKETTNKIVLDIFEANMIYKYVLHNMLEF